MTPIATSAESVTPRRLAGLAWGLACLGGTLLLLHPRVPSLVEAAVPFLDPAGRKRLESLAHFGVYLLLGLGLLWPGRPTPCRRAAPVAVVLLVHGAVVEGLQVLMPHRSPDWGDWISNAAGVGAAVGLAALGGSMGTRAPSPSPPAPCPETNRPLEPADW